MVTYDWSLIFRPLFTLWMYRSFYGGCFIKNTVSLFLIEIVPLPTDYRGINFLVYLQCLIPRLVFVHSGHSYVLLLSEWRHYKNILYVLVFAVVRVCLCVRDSFNGTVTVFTVQVPSVPYYFLRPVALSCGSGRSLRGRRSLYWLCKVVLVPDAHPPLSVSPRSKD